MGCIYKVCDLDIIHRETATIYVSVQCMSNIYKYHAELNTFTVQVISQYTTMHLLATHLQLQVKKLQLTSLTSMHLLQVAYSHKRDTVHLLS